MLHVAELQMDRRGSPRFARASRAALARLSISILAAASLAACGGGPGGDSSLPPGGQAASNPVGDAYAALAAGAYEALPGIIAALDEAVEKNPDDGVSALYAGVMHLWRVTHMQPDPNRDLVQIALDAQAGIENLERATRLRPENEHSAAFLGIAQIGSGNFVGDEARIAEGATILHEAVPLNPPYVHGVEALAFGALDRDHPLFAKAAEALLGTVEACGYGGSGEFGLSFPYPTGPLPGVRRVCNDSGIVAHVWEGFFLTFGDVFVKQGEAEKARVLYENAKSSPVYETWLLRDLLEERIAQASARAELYLDGDPSNDPLTWMEEGRLCVGCHASTR